VRQAGVEANRAAVEGHCGFRRRRGVEEAHDELVHVLPKDRGVHACCGVVCEALAERAKLVEHAGRAALSEESAEAGDHFVVNRDGDPLGLDVAGERVTRDLADRLPADSWLGVELVALVVLLADLLLVLEHAKRAFEEVSQVAEDVDARRAASGVERDDSIDSQAEVGEAGLHPHALEQHRNLLLEARRGLVAACACVDDGDEENEVDQVEETQRGLTSCADGVLIVGPAVAMGFG
jgi:hypothetical protein